MSRGREISQEDPWGQIEGVAKAKEASREKTWTNFGVIHEFSSWQRVKALPIKQRTKTDFFYETKVSVLCYLPKTMIDSRRSKCSEGQSTRVFRETRQGGRCLTQFSAQLAISCLSRPSSSWEGGGGGGHPTWLEWKVGWLGKRDNLIIGGSFFLNTGFSRKRKIPRKLHFAFPFCYVSEQNN